MNALRERGSRTRSPGSTGRAAGLMRPSRVIRGSYTTWSLIARIPPLRGSRRSYCASAADRGARGLPLVPLAGGPWASGLAEGVALVLGVGVDHVSWLQLAASLAAVWLNSCRTPVAAIAFKGSVRRAGQPVVHGRQRTLVTTVCRWCIAPAPASDFKTQSPIPANARHIGVTGRTRDGGDPGHPPVRTCAALATTAGVSEEMIHNVTVGTETLTNPPASRRLRASSQRLTASTDGTPYGHVLPAVPAVLGGVRPFRRMRRFVT
jgi:hypothetical protein